MVVGATLKSQDKRQMKRSKSDGNKPNHALRGHKNVKMAGVATNSSSNNTRDSSRMNWDENIGKKVGKQRKTKQTKGVQLDNASAVTNKILETSKSFENVERKRVLVRGFSESMATKSRNGLNTANGKMLLKKVNGNQSPNKECLKKEGEYPVPHTCNRHDWYEF